jgi:hypothetical protein
MAFTKELTRLFSGVHRALQVYATPVTSHALQIYQSLWATSLERGLLEYMVNDHIITPRIESQTALKLEFYSTSDRTTHRLCQLGYLFVRRSARSLRLERHDRTGVGRAGRQATYRAQGPQ